MGSRIEDMRELTIDGIAVNDASACFVIAEIGPKHQGDVKKWKEVVRLAQEAGATAVKLKKRDNRSLYTREMYDRPYDNENSFGPLTAGIARHSSSAGR